MSPMKNIRSYQLFQNNLYIYKKDKYINSNLKLRYHLNVMSMYSHVGDIVACYFVNTLMADSLKNIFF